MLARLRQFVPATGSSLVPACLIRGGTSKGVFLLSEDVPAAGPERDEVILNLLGSPDPTGKQLDGLGGGISSTSKVAIMRARPDGLAEYLFGQVALREAMVDWEGSCGNLAAAAGLFAYEQNVLPENALLPSSFSPNHIVVPLWQANASYRMHVHVPRRDASISEQDFVSVSGVPGKAPAVLVEVLDPCAGKDTDFLPTKNVMDTLTLENGQDISATLVLGANPTVFVQPSALGLDGKELPEDVDFASLWPTLRHLMAQAADRMGIEYSAAMRVCWVSPTRDYSCTDGATVSASDVDLLSRITTEGRVHHAHTATGALNLGMAACIPGTVPYEALGAAAGRLREVRVGHPAGTLGVSATVEQRRDGTWDAKAAGMVRTARTLFTGLAEGRKC
ncbi:Aconitate-delta-isomerase 1 [Hondaea fermentalgiana]|uniref:Aconitate-delta-isomerase 1 n=1 Tax=Hondaea fermentalgiana TaxID=2315210 RepID=A0A2R5GT56_9STRA|nr:Aconitate-delta-isomerase 1 [Hondaea fermentalgiana]|eukprot:GBG34042.1 Aconitate-delta-isomerase 1 [Hondaea fermentalgiana]